MIDDTHTSATVKEGAQPRSVADRTPPDPTGRRVFLALGSTGLFAALGGCLSGADEDDDRGLIPGLGGSGDDSSGDGDGEETDGDGDGANTGDEDIDDGAGDDTDDGREILHDLPFQEDFTDMAALHASSAYGALSFDTTGTPQFARPDGAETETDPSRMNRQENGHAHIVFGFTDRIGRVRLEGHVHPDFDGAIDLSVSADGERWDALDVGVDHYSEAHGDEDEPGHWWDNYEYTAIAPEGVTYLRLTLSGEEHWTPQLGHLEVSSRDDLGTVHSLPFEDGLASIDSLHESSDLANLWLDTSNDGQFARPTGETDPSRLNRANADDAHVIYRFDRPIGGFRVETHYHPDDGTDIAVSVSTDGDEWTPVEADRDRYSEAHDDEDEPGHWWDNYEYTADAVDDGFYFLRVTLSGPENWASQLGWVDVW
ncbi:hypothetical protein [Natronobiforma cellulositropha]|uniref:hypothetical protein n=1 Tax=Natronobiforma cellulositropha TaxID=1679076 RepID=UPI0021D5C42B|nr:hypothetical protein [Natronobiforma cellulositropha]